MTNEKTEKVMYKTPAGEIFDVIGAFERHPAITPGKANIDLWVKSERYNGTHFELRLSAETMARLVEILNAAPVDGNPLNAIVNLEIDSTASDYAREKIARYLADNGYEATLENVAAAFIYTETEFSQLDINLQGTNYRLTTQPPRGATATNRRPA